MAVVVSSVTTKRLLKRETERERKKQSDISAASGWRKFDRRQCASLPAHYDRRYQRLWKASHGGGGGGGGLACDGRVAGCGAAGDESAAIARARARARARSLARIIGIKRPICRPMIASRSAT